MTKAILLAATAAIALAATPALAQDTAKPHSNVHMKSSKLRHHDAHHARAMHSGARLARRDDFHNKGRRSGLRPADTTAGIAGGAIGTAGAIASDAVNTAGAIATAPFRGPHDDGYYGRYNRPYGDVAYRGSYSYDDAYASMDAGFAPDNYSYNYNGTAIPGSPSFDARNGFTCRPGTIIQLNGQPTLCQ